MPTLNYTTTIPSTRTIGEMQAMLARHGATAVATHYIEGSAAGVSFSLDTPHGSRTFTLPVDVDAVHRLLQRQLADRKITKRSYGERAHAERVAWRVAKDWLAAQLALIEAQMATLDQVMLPYLRVDDSRTLYEAYRDREAAALEAGQS